VVTLTLYILGLTGLISFTDQGRLGVDVVLPKIGRDMPAHVARFHVDKGNGPTNQDLAGYAIRIKCGAGSASTSPSGLEAIMEDASSPWRGLSWAADLSTIMNRPQPRPGWMKGGDGRVTTAIRLSEGRLEGAPPVEPAFANTIWSFGRRTQAFTDRVQYTLTCSGDEIELELYPIAPGGTKRTLRLTPPSGKKDVIATISHLAKVRVPSTTGMLMHFGAIYQLLDNPPAERLVPSVAQRIRPDATWDDPPNCSDPIFIVPPVPRPTIGPDPPPW
jgi:hypothetical protein